MSNVLANKLRAVNMITEQEATSALNMSEKEGISFLLALESLGIKSEKDLIDFISIKFGIERDAEALKNLDKEVAEKLDLSFSQQYNIISYKEVEGSIYVAVVDPFDRKVLENARVQLQSRRRLIPVIVSQDTIRSMLSELQEDVQEDFSDIFDDDRELSSEDIESINISSKVDSAPLVKLVDSILLEAYRKGVSDIHIEPEERITNVRFRVDGSLFNYKSFDKVIHNKIIARLKVIAGMEPSQQNIPQDGSFKFKSQYVSFDLRVSTLPTATGEKAVLRLLGADQNITYDLYSLGLNDYVIEAIEKTIKLPNGILLVTGPTGSGKTTTLYSILHKLATPDTSVVTVEDPVERNIAGITQVQMNAKSGLSFANALRSILRQDPDTIMIGEMRDSETATIAARAAITGHFVLSTIHTNDAISTVSRLVDMGVEPFMISSALKTVIAQRLVRKNCEYCRTEHINTDLERELINMPDTLSYQGEGCEECNFTGYKGRTAVFEILTIDNTLQKMISSQASIDEMQEYIDSKEDMRTMRDEVFDLVRNGTTSIDEAIKILYSND